MCVHPPCSVSLIGRLPSVHQQAKMPGAVTACHSAMILCNPTWLQQRCNCTRGIKRVKIVCLLGAPPTTTPPVKFTFSAYSGMDSLQSGANPCQGQATADICQLLVRHFPRWLTQEEKESFLSHFGATEVVSMPPRGKMVCLCHAS